jgi:hypothetical protein
MTSGDGLRHSPPGRLTAARESLRYALPCAIVWSIYLLAYWPGLMSYDSLQQWEQMTTGQLDNWHPAFHTMSNWLITRLWLSPAAVALTQIATLSLLVGWTVARIRRLGAPGRALDRHAAGGPLAAQCHHGRDPVEGRPLQHHRAGADAVRPGDRHQRRGMARSLESLDRARHHRGPGRTLPPQRSCRGVRHARGARRRVPSASMAHRGRPDSRARALAGGPGPALQRAERGLVHLGALPATDSPGGGAHRRRHAPHRRRASLPGSHTAGRRWLAVLVLLDLPDRRRDVPARRPVADDPGRSAGIRTHLVATHAP